MGVRSAVWIDVEDLFHYVRHNTRPSGIQRLTYELYTALVQGAGAGRAIGFVRIDPGTDEFRRVEWGQVEALCRGLTQGAPAVLPRPRPAGRARPRDLAIAVQDRLPISARLQFRRFCTLQAAALRSLRELGRDGGGLAGRDPEPVPVPVPVPVPEPAAAGPDRLRDIARPGDWLLSLGASWHRVDYGALLGRMRAESGLRTAMLFYDLIPLRRPEWCHHTLVASFGSWLDGVLPSLDALFAISAATSADLARLLADAPGRPGLPALPDGAPIRTLPLGSGFPASVAGRRDAEAAVPHHALPPAGSYVLFVSTIEARKNHVLMFQVWRRLLQTMPPAEVPTLVFAGRIGWLVADLMLQIANTNYCDGKLLIVEDPSDAMLTRLYDGCLFTVLPSLFEGWGLPVTESLAAGKPCVTSNLSALPEAGAGLTRMLDPYDLNDAVRVIGGILADRPALARWEERVRDEYVPVTWRQSADALLRGLDEHGQEPEPEAPPATAGRRPGGTAAQDGAQGEAQDGAQGGARGGARARQAVHG